jgi:acyl-CoA thioesterase
MGFRDASAVQQEGDGRYAATVDPAWQAINGPNGGYLAAIMARATREEVADAGRALRSITVHYLSPARVDDLTVDVTIERRGRSVVSASAWLSQGARTIAMALAAFSPPWAGIAYEETSRPHLPPPASLPRFTPRQFVPLPIFGAVDVRLDDDPYPLSGVDRARIAGWLRPERPEPVDEIWLVAAADTLPPAVFGRLTEPIGSATIELTVHLRVAHPQHHLPEGGFLGAEFVAPTAADGFLVEDGILWAPDGTLLAQSRQLAIAR